MMNILYATILLSLIGAVSGLALYFVAQKFKVVENPMIDDVEKMLPGANCGGCGFPGCRKFAETLVNSDSIDHLYCNPAGGEQMQKIGEFLGKSVAKKDSMVAVVRCAGSCDNRPKTNEYQGITSCSFVSTLYLGDTDCSYGCYGLGDCVAVCNFNAITIDAISGLPVVTTAACTACGACVDACPKNIIELRKTNKKDTKIFVSCVNKEKGAIAKKHCSVACIGCGKCAKICPYNAIVVENSLAYIDFELCRLCRKCVDVCPTKAIVETNFAIRAPKNEVEQDSKTEN